MQPACIPSLQRRLPGGGRGCKMLTSLSLQRSTFDEGPSVVSSFSTLLIDSQAVVLCCDVGGCGFHAVGGFYFNNYL